MTQWVEEQLLTLDPRGRKATQGWHVHPQINK